MLEKVYRRTARGRRMALQASQTASAVPELAQHLLLCFTGFTPLQHLRAQWPDDAQLAAAVQWLLDAELIEEAGPVEPPLVSLWGDLNALVPE